MRKPALLLALAVLCTAVSAFAADDATYRALRTAAPDGRTIALSNFVYERDVLRFTLNGTLHLLTPVDNKTPGAVFVGQGSYELKPATAAETRQLAINAGDDKLTTVTDTFESAVFLGTALVDAAAKASAPVQGPPIAGNDKWIDYMNKQRKLFHTNVHVRLAQDWLNGFSEPLFFSYLNGRKYPPVVLIVDPLGAESVRLAGQGLGGEQTQMYVVDNNKGGIWYSSRLKSEVDKGMGVAIKPLADADHYLIDNSIDGSKLNATSTLTFTANSDLRLLPIHLSGKLAISSASYAPAVDAPQWTPVAWIQEDGTEDPDAAVVFPEKLKAGQKYLLKMTYDGKEVLDNAGDGNFYVGSRMSWYPNVGVFSDLATYELRFRVPQKMQIVGVGTETENKVEGDQRVQVWKTTGPVRVAGFNYGKFKKQSTSDQDSGMTVDVFTNPGTPDIIRQINNALSAMQESGEYMGPSYVKIDTGKLAQSAMADGINTARVANMFFGPVSHKNVAITQQSQWSFGQSWPSLIYMPYIAFLDGTTRNTLGLNDAKDFIDSVGAHEFAHQWWGHQIGTHSYRDEWISEGFSEFTAALVLQQTGGWAKYNDFWEKKRRHILDKPRGAFISNDEAGPISQGWRISSWRAPGAYSAITYSKGAYVLHMLRMTMWDTKKGDEAFINMMRDFATTYAGKNASTGDFQRVVEKHATDSLKIATNGKLDWFFQQWVHGTAIPRYTSKFDFQDIGGGKYKVTGTITQSDVPDNFAVVLPMYVHFDKNTASKFGSTIIVGNQTKPMSFEIALPKKPQKFSVNHMHDVLAR
jgi:hypothetical protein